MSKNWWFLVPVVFYFGCSSLDRNSGPSPVALPGEQSSGSVLLPNQWSLRPAGRQLDLGDFPVNIAVHPSGNYAAILHAGYSKHEIVVVKLDGEKVVSRTPLEETFYGIEFSRDGSEIFSSGAGNEVIHRFAFANGELSNHREIKLGPVAERGIPSGLAIHHDLKRLYVANVWGQKISQVDLGEKRNLTQILLAKPVAPPGNLPLPPEDPDLAAATKRATAAENPMSILDPFPYACRIDPSRELLYVSLWAHASVAVIDLKRNLLVARWPAQEHPNEMVLSRDGKKLYVANANRNSVSVLDTTSGTTLETILSAMFPDSLPGSTPNSLALSPDEKTLYVANACNNNVAVFDVSTPGRARSLGFIPVGWYPTSVRVTPDGKKLLVANGKGLRSRANPNGPQPGKRVPAGTVVEYIGSLLQGSLSIVDLPRPAGMKDFLARTTAECYRCLPRKPGQTAGANTAVPQTEGGKSPIKYVLYIIKENRTYDQVLGDMREGNGDPSLCLFPERVTPNHHQLARDFVLLDNFYVESEVSADGHEWTMGAYATDFVEKFWPLSYGHNKKHGKYMYPAEGKFKIAEPSSGYLWDRAAEAGVTYRSYGEFMNNPKSTNQPVFTRVKSLQGHFDPWYWTFDMEYPDVKRAARFISELKRFEAEGEMPRLQMIRLPNDHTYGASAGKLSPTALVADNDYALGLLVEAISQSKFWAQTAIFVVEDDAQNGPDHVDAHRSIAFAISPYVKRHTVDSTMYSTSSMLRTMELILGLKAMTQFDAAAMPMFKSFGATPDLRPYKAIRPEIDMNEHNLKTAWGSERARKMDFTREDAADDLLLNEMIWRSVKGRNHPMPAPTRAAFVFAREKADDDD